MDSARDGCLNPVTVCKPCSAILCESPLHASPDSAENSSFSFRKSKMPARVPSASFSWAQGACGSSRCRPPSSFASAVPPSFVRGDPVCAQLSSRFHSLTLPPQLAASASNSFFFFNFIYLFLAVLGLRRCTRALSSSGGQGRLSGRGPRASHFSGSSHYRAGPRARGC